MVVNVVDGDTIDVTVDGVEYRVRCIGIDTPETVHPTRGVEPCGKDASDRNAQLVEGETVQFGEGRQRNGPVREAAALGAVGGGVGRRVGDIVGLGGGCRY